LASCAAAGQDICLWDPRPARRCGAATFAGPVRAGAGGAGTDWRPPAGGWDASNPAARPPAEAQTGTEQSSQCACFTCSCVGAMVATCPPSASSHSRGHGICVAAAACARSGVWPQWYVPRARVHQVYAAGRGDPDLSARSAPSTSSISL
jgi:hypothetical protein